MVTIDTYIICEFYVNSMTEKFNISKNQNNNELFFKN